MPRKGGPLIAVLLAACLAGCGQLVAPVSGAAPTPSRVTSTPPGAPVTEQPSVAATADPGAAATPTPSSPTLTAEPSTAPALATSDGRPRRALLTIRAIGIRELPVVPYRGRTDDAPGTRIQNRGLAASPHGPSGGVGPGGIGNYQVTAHRLSSTQAFLRLPELDRGDRILVDVGATRYVYEVRNTRTTSFRSARSLAEQRAAVPGRPGAEPTLAFVTLSTCATPEDHDAGNWWSDEHGNPEHRIDKIGVLVAVRSLR